MWNAEKIIIPPGKREELLKELTGFFIKMEHHKISKLFNDSVVSKFVTRKWIEENDLSGGQYCVNKNM